MMDRISQLPESIVHHILSFCNTPAEVVRMSVLSKTWFHLTASFNVLDFDCRYFFRSDESFFKYVEYTVSRFCHQNVTAHRLKLSANIWQPAELDIVNRCLERVLEKGVRELVINVSNSLDLPMYRVPDMLFSVPVLTSFTMFDCELPSSLTLDSCPLLQDILLEECHGLKTFCVHGHQNLRKVAIHYITPVERIDIVEAPNLSSLSIIDFGGSNAPQMNLALCEKLTSVTYFGPHLPNPNVFLSNFPSIEKLCLGIRYKYDKLKLSSNSLRRLMLDSSCEFEEIELNIPNLELFGYPFNGRSLRHLEKHLPHLNACMLCEPGRYIDPLWIQNLREFLDKKTGFKVLNLCIQAMYSEQFTELEKLKAIELPPYKLEHVELQLQCRDSLDDIAFVEAVLWCCRPRSLTLRSSSYSTYFEEHSDVVMFTYEKLLEQEDQGHTNIQIDSPPSSLFKSLLGKGIAISFIKEEAVQEEAG